MTEQLKLDNEPGWDVARQYDGVEVQLTILPPFEDKDVVLSALKKQLEERVIDLDTYKDRRQAYLEKLLPEPPDIVA